jgi:large subunit ribosomal protein L3
MALGMLGKKIGMTQRFDEEGHVVPITVLHVGPCPVVQKKTRETDGYDALQIGFGSRKKQRTTRPLAGHFQKAGVEPTARLREIRVSAEEAEQYEVGGEINIDLFEKGEYVDVVGRTKGRGFAGVMKRHNFAGKNRTHGTHEYFRHGGAIGMCATPSRLMKGKRMPGQMGDSRSTMLNLLVVDVKKEQNLLFVRGAVPGAKNGFVFVRKAVKKKANRE